MSRLLTRSIVLTISRISNYAILLLSPLFLVRIFDVVQYGQYREFMVYATFVIAISGFALDRSLTYFLPKYPEYERTYVTQVTLFVFLISLVVVIILLVSEPVIELYTSYNFVAYLAAYVFFFVNLNFLEYYWIAKKRTDLVLIYSSARLIIRVSAVVITAYVTRDLQMVLAALVATESIRVAVVIIIVSRLNLIELAFDKVTILKHLGYVGPLGLSTIVQSASRDVSKLFISIVLGPVALAYYSIGGYLSPIVQTFRVSISDVIFPELTKKAGSVESALRLWRRATVMYTVVMFPLFAIVEIHAQSIVVILFTEEYLPAVLIFQVYGLYLLRRCFAFDVLLRREGRTDLVLKGSIFGLFINIAFLYPSYKLLGILGPAVTVIVTEVITEWFFAAKTVRMYKSTLREMIDFVSIGKVLIPSILVSPVLLLPNVLSEQNLVSVVGSSVFYLGIVLATAALLGVDDVKVVRDYFLEAIRPRK